MRTPLVALVPLALAFVPAARAAAPEGATLQQEVKALQAMVQDLQRRVSALEGHPVLPAAASQSVPQAAPARSAAPAAVPQMPAASLPQAAPIAAAQPGASAGYMSPEAMLRAAWSKVGKGMQDGEITRLLGAPSKKFTLDGRTVWYYYYPATGSGSVFFTDEGRVSSRQSPFGWGW